jgi:DNA-binding transcriptional LysR family regulator
VLDWNDLRYFLAVARAGSTIAAAKLLGVSQPTVQRRLAVLEGANGRKLVEPHPTGYRLTELGKSMLPHAEHIAEGVAAFERNLASSDHSLTGTIKVTCPEAMVSRFLTPLVEEFRARHPQLHVDLLLTDRIVDLAKGEADVALRTHEVNDNTLVVRRLADMPWAIYASRSYVERHGQPRRIEEIDDHAVIGFVGEMANNHGGRWLRAVAPRARIAARGNTMLGLVAAVKSGAGLAPLPAILGEVEDDLERVLDPVTELDSRIYLVMHRDLRDVPRVRAFCDFIVAEIARFRPLLTGRGR